MSFTPRACLGAGKDVTSCSMEFFRKVKATCAAEFMSYVNCMEKSSGDMQFYECRKTQGVYDKCVEEKMGLKRPHYGYHCLPKVNEISLKYIFFIFLPRSMTQTGQHRRRRSQPGWRMRRYINPMKTIFVIPVFFPQQYGVLILSFTKQLFHAGEEAW